LSRIQGIPHPFILEQLGFAGVEPETVTVRTAVDNDIAAIGDLGHSMPALWTLDAVYFGVVIHPSYSLGIVECCTIETRSRGFAG
jgi:hypothetical protein